jgi:glycosyltransferase involved in cell wall biosynthesis
MRVITRLNVGGPARHAIILSRALGERGFHSELIFGQESPHEGAFLPADDNYTRVPALKRPVDPFSDVQAVLTLFRIIRNRQPHIVHTHTAKAGALGRVAARLAQVPFVVHTFHGHVLDGYYPDPISRGLAAAERALARKTNVLVAVSEAIRDQLLDLGIGQPSQWRVIPVGLELDALLKASLSTFEARRALGLPSDGPIVGVVSRLVPIKDHETFLQAACLILKRQPDATFLIAGDGELRQMLEHRARTLLGERIRFLGWASDVATLYRALDVVVLTSRKEGTPLSLIEAAAAGRPVVATRVGGVSEVVRDGETGLLVRAQDPEQVSSAVLCLLNQPERARAMRSKAREWVRHRFSAERLINDVAALYQDLFSHHGITKPIARSEGTHS